MDRNTYIADNWLRDDKELGILPISLLSERKLPKVKKEYHISVKYVSWINYTAQCMADWVKGSNFHLVQI